MAAGFMIFARSFGVDESHAKLSLVVTVKGEEVFDEPVGEITLPFRLNITGAHGGENIFVLQRYGDEADESGRPQVFSGNNDTLGVALSCVYSDCPEQICVNTGTVTNVDTPIVCLPHEVIARLSFD